jgi:glycosyltransferase involved in cell wall biosynthesis
MTPTVSIVLPAYNVESYLEAAVASVGEQTLETWQLVIVDDGSTDATGALADALARADDRITVVHQPNGGVSRARNAGLARSDPRTEAVVFLDADDVWEPDALEILTAALDRRPDAAAVYGFPRLFDDVHTPRPEHIEDAPGQARHAVRGRRRARVPVDAPASFEVLCVWPCIMTGGQLLIRRTAFPDAAPFEPDILSQDWLFWLRLSLRGDIAPVQEFVIRKRERSDSLMRSSRFGEAESIVRRKLIGGPELTSERLEVARNGHRWATAERLSWAWSDVRRRQFVTAAKHVRQFVLAAVACLRMGDEYRARIRAARAVEARSRQVAARVLDPTSDSATRSDST